MIDHRCDVAGDEWGLEQLSGAVDHGDDVNCIVLDAVGRLDDLSDVPLRNAPAGIRKLREEETIKKDDVVVGILTGRQKDSRLSVEYHTEASNMFARPPRIE